MGDIITVFGGSGFVGRHAVNALLQAGKRVRIAVRRPHLALDSAALGRTGQVHIVQANVRFPDSVARAVDGASGVVNLVGVLAESGKQTFKAVQADGADIVARAAAAAGISRLVQVSAIGTDARSKSRYARAKAAGEAAARAALPGCVILRPSLVFGPEDDFFNRFAAMARSSPLMPLIGGGHTRFQPIYVGDLARAILAGLDQPGARGRIFELGGPHVYSFKELLGFIMREAQRPRPFVPLPFFLAEPMGAMAGGFSRLMPLFKPMITSDQVRLLKKDNVVGASGQAGLGKASDLGLEPLETIEAITRSYLWRFRPYGQFSAATNASV